MDIDKIPVLPGQSFPLGATYSPQGVNFSVFSKNCTGVELVLFNDASGPAIRTIKLDPVENKTFYYWHCYLPKLPAGTIYGYRVHGPYEPDAGFYFDGAKLLLDPYAKEVIYGDNYSRGAACLPGDNSKQAMRGVVVDMLDFDWEGDQPLTRPLTRTVVYEMHVAGFTKHESSGLSPDKRGTYAGLIEKIPYLQELGVTCVELLPVQQFDKYDALEGKTNYWGYSPIGFFAPHREYAHNSTPQGPVNEFREMVKALHKAGIEVILDVVFNHTAEGNEQGPTISFRGFENRAYYILNDDMSGYKNYSGCGNTFNANQSISRRMILESLRYWVQEMHVDGFRFDLASVFARDEEGRPLKSPPIIWEIESDPVLAGTKIIAEPWDTGQYHGQGFIGHKWAVWHDLYRDDSRRFVRGDKGFAGAMAHRITGSPPDKPDPNANANRNMIFIDCHDGFTLNDLVSYNEKHNDANGEGNRDGHPTNYSANYGVEGPSGDAGLNSLRLRQMKNFLAILFLSQGTQMIQMGDELGRTQHGNNNAYCQDNETGWLDWSLLQNGTSSELFRYTRNLIRLNHSLSYLQEDRYWADDNRLAGARVHWHGTKLNRPDWAYHSHSLAYSLHNDSGVPDYFIIMNLFWEDLEFELPRVAGKQWAKLLDTTGPSPEEVPGPDEKVPAMSEQSVYLARNRSVVVLGAV